MHDTITTNDTDATNTTNTATSTSVIDVYDFSSRTTDVLRDTWTAGKMRHVINALAGSPVVITVDRRSGHSRIGVTLVGVTRGRYDSTGYRVQVRDDHGVTNFRLDNIGAVIVPLVADNAKWEAIERARLERMAAISKARAEAPDFDEPLRWEASADANGVHVGAFPCSGQGTRAVPLWSTAYSISDLR